MNTSATTACREQGPGYFFSRLYRCALLLCCILLFAGSGAAFDCHESPLSPAGTCCLLLYNLQESNRMQLAGPAVVDYSESTGNLLVRGPLPLIVRDGTGQRGNCLNHADWKFAYDNLNGMLKSTKTFAPAYFTAEKKATFLIPSTPEFSGRDGPQTTHGIPGQLSSKSLSQSVVGKKLPA